MPCYQNRDDVPSTPQINIEPIIRGTSESRYNLYSTELIKENNYLEACLCAIITELEKKKIANEIITKASRSGLLNIMSFWLEHSKKDKTRISNEFHSFSEHEQSLIRKLIINGEL
jgi:hypothetical protein